MAPSIGSQGLLRFTKLHLPCIVILMVKYLTWFVLVSVLYITIFVPGTNIDNGKISIMAMLLLLSLYPDLKEFNFWGLKGKKSERDIQQLEGKQALSDKQVEVDPDKLDEAEKAPTPIQLMDTSQGNLLALAFEVERLLRIMGTVGLEKNVPSTINIRKLSSELRAADLLTDAGVKQIEAIQWIRNILVHGRQSEINQATLDAGIDVAYSLYTELYEHIYREKPVI